MWVTDETLKVQSQIKIFAPYVEEEPSKEDLDNRNRAMSEKKCVICMDAKINAVCVPCGHRCLCEGCIEIILKQGNCPICR